MLELLSVLSMVLGWYLYFAFQIIKIFWTVYLVSLAVTLIILLICRLIKRAKGAGYNIIIGSTSFLLVLMFALWGVSGLMDKYPTVEINGVKYRSGFYDGMGIEKVIHEGDAYIRGYSEEFYRIKHSKFDIYHTGGYVNYNGMSSAVLTHGGGELYCNVEQWDEAKEYYGNLDNYIAVCSPHADNLSDMELNNFDVEIIDKLYELEISAFNSVDIEASSYEDYEEKCFDVYRLSKDGIMHSYYSNTLRFFDGQLYVCGSVHINKGITYVECTPVDEELSDYVFEKIGDWAK